MTSKNIAGYESPDEYDVAENCGRLAIGCSDAMSRINEVNSNLSTQLDRLAEIEKVIASFQADQASLADSSETTKMISARTRSNLDRGARQVASSLEDFSSITELIGRLGHHVNNFSVVLGQVRRVSKTIDGIAKTTNMLALNAAIEAQRAGNAGLAFGVVASEIKKLADDTRVATDEISRSVDMLSKEGAEFITEVHVGVEKSQAAENAFNTVTAFIQEATSHVEALDRQADTVATTAGAMRERSAEVEQGLNKFSSDIRSSAGVLQETRKHVSAMQNLSSGMFNALVHLGMSAEDQHFIERARQEHALFLGLIKSALANGSLITSELFDTQYVMVPKTSPPLYRTRMSDWADEVIRPQIDRILASDRRIKGAVLTDMNGFLPTHATERSQPPTGNVEIDTAYSRNGRIILSPEDRQAKQSSADYMMGIYHLAGEADIMRNIYVPIHIDGRRWGDFELAYVID